MINFILLTIIFFLSKALTAASRWQRRLCFLLPFIMRVCLTVFRVLKWGGGNPDSLIHVFLQVSSITECY